MPLRDHFRPPLDTSASWEELHGQWPAAIVAQLNGKLPLTYVAGPVVHVGSQVEIDVAAYESEAAPPSFGTDDSSGGMATAVWVPAAPSVAVETELPDYDEYEVRIYDVRRGRRLVAAIELVSPRNLDRPESRNAFVGKCAALLQKGVAVSIVDLVTVRHFNLYADLMAFIGQSDPTLGADPPSLYAASCRWFRKETRAMLETWSHGLTLGQPLPTLPLWLSDVLVVPLDLEQSYEQACKDLRIR
ncbi:MAG: DUF4058 family protein [Gemmataceae bacterium]